MTISKILSLDRLLEAAAAQRAASRQIVFANGAFDLLHAGHVRYLEAARAEGDWLVVGVNSDESVRRTKGPARPIVPEQERAEIISALGCVDAVVVFGEDSPERAVVATYGGRTAIVGDPKDHATTDLIERIRETGDGRR